LVFAHRALAARRAEAVRCALVVLAARARPPLRENSCRVIRACWHALTKRQVMTRYGMKHTRASSGSGQRQAGGILLAVGIVAALIGIGLAVYQARETAEFGRRHAAAMVELESVEVRAEAVRRRLIALGEKLDY